MLCHFDLVLKLDFKTAIAPNRASSSTPGPKCRTSLLQPEIEQFRQNTIAVFAMHKCDCFGRIIGRGGAPARAE
jgi:hypothetical protein